MTANANDVYQEIGVAVNSAINEEWDEATIDFEFFGDAGTAKGRYVASNGEGAKNFKTGYKIFKLFKSLHAITCASDSNMWNRAAYSLKKDGQFSIDFQWDQGLADEIERLANS